MNSEALLLSLECGGRIVVPRVRRARGFLGRTLGLMGRPDFPPGEGLWLSPCGAIHTCFMRFAIDAVFLDRDERVVRVATHIKPWRCCSGGRGAASVVETRAGGLDPAGLPIGAAVRWIPISFGAAAAPGK